MIVMPNEGLLEMLQCMMVFGGSELGNIELHLYKNDYTPVAATTIANFTECDFSGYASVLLSVSSWVDLAIVSGKSRLQYGSGPLTWTVGSTGNTVYGYYVTSDEHGVCMWAQRFDVPRVLATGDELDLTLVFTLGNQT